MSAQQSEVERLNVGVDQLYGVAVPRPGVLMVTSICGVLTTEDSGQIWMMQTFPNCRGITDVEFRGSIGLLTDAGGIWRSIDTGRTWDLVYPKSNDVLRGRGLNFNEITFVDSSVALAVGTLNTAFRSTDAGSTWTRIRKLDRFGMYDIAFYNDLEGIVLADSKTLYLTTDGGVTWKDTVSSFANSPESEEPVLSRISCPDKHVCIAISTDGTVFRSEDNGVHWNPSSGTPTDVRRLWDVEFVSPLRGVVVGGGKIFTTSDGGHTWSNVYSREYYDLYRVYFVDQNNIVAVGEEGAIVRLTLEW